MPERDKSRLLLRIAEEANSQLDFGKVLEAACEALNREFQVDAIAVITKKGDRLQPHTVYIAGQPRRPNESSPETIRRAKGELPAVASGDSTVALPYAGSGTEHVATTGRAYLCRDLRAEARFVEDERLLRFGVLSYVRTPMVVRDRMIGSIGYIRGIRAGRPEPPPFEEHEAAFLEEVTRPIAAAVSNALAYEEIDRLRALLESENVALREEIDERSMFAEIVGSSAAIRAVLAQIEKIAPTESTVLITGETGTGKELLARAIHKRSRRAERALVTVNCAALPPSLIASELFGHERGAFTGAVARRVGRFELASRGSIFLDEIGDLSAEMQVALLRVLQEGEFERVGGSQTIRTDARIIAATNRNLREEVEAGRFRSDLFYRLNVIPIEVPPLRARKEDIPILVEFFAAHHGARIGKHFRQIDRKSMERLSGYSWPGNVRELENVIERAAILSPGDTLVVDETFATGAERSAMRARSSLRHETRRHEKQAIEAALEAARGRVSGPGGAAAALGMPSTTLESKIRTLGIDKYRFKRAR